MEPEPVFINVEPFRIRSCHPFVFVFCDGAKGSRTSFIGYPMWLDDCERLERDICRSEAWSTEAKVDSMEWCLSWGTDRRVVEDP
jgi:hypothetical protein